MIISFLYIVLLLFGYFIGSVNFAFLLSDDSKSPSKLGSSNPGTTNMFRIYGIRRGFLTFLGDMSKSLIFLWFLSANFDLGLHFIFTALIVGHIYPIYYNFIGGKGVATYFGGIWFVNAEVGILSLGIWLGVFLYTRVVGIASVVSFFVIIFLSYILLDLDIWLSLNIVHGLILFRHWPNIRSYILNFLDRVS